MEVVSSTVKEEDDASVKMDQALFFLYNKQVLLSAVEITRPDGIMRLSACISFCLIVVVTWWLFVVCCFVVLLFVVLLVVVCCFVVSLFVVCCCCLLFVVCFCCLFVCCFNECVHTGSRGARVIARDPIGKQCWDFELKDVPFNNTNVKESEQLVVFPRIDIQLNPKQQQLPQKTEEDAGGGEAKYGSCGFLVLLMLMLGC